MGALQKLFLPGLELLARRFDALDLFLDEVVAPPAVLSAGLAGYEAAGKRSISLARLSPS
jgi:hypothetical protein